MSLQSFFLLYVISLPIYFIMEILWLTVFARSFYQNKLKPLLGPVNWPAGIFFYVVYTFGLVLFATAPAVEVGQWHMAALYGSLFGFFTYATYELTNLSTLKDWPLTVVLVDIIWGSILCAVVATSTFYVYSIVT